ncbi:MAG: hypothetical protein HY737_06585 [Candidatus Omnitrophica bacterium]|nr:hypothetical protein [Candidatus Omnitrophota bacterium]
MNLERRRRILLWCAASLMAASWTGAWASGRTLKSSTQNYEQVPVVARASTASLIERQTASAEAAARSTPPKAAPARALVSTSDTTGQASRFVGVATASRSAKTEQEYWLRGDVKCWNKSPKTAEALGLLIVPMDQYQGALSTSRKNLVRLSATIYGGSEQSFRWETVLEDAEAVQKLEQVVVAILTIKFADGSVWEAPDVELVGFF